MISFRKKKARTSSDWASWCKDWGRFFRALSTAPLLFWMLVTAVLFFAAIQASDDLQQFLYFLTWIPSWCVGGVFYDAYRESPSKVRKEILGKIMSELMNDKKEVNKHGLMKIVKDAFND